MALKKAENHQYPGLTRETEGTWKQPFCFIQSADTQFGLIDNWNGVPEEQNTWDKEIELTNRAIDCVNIMQPRPKFMVICGDLVDAQPWKKPRYELQVADFKKCFARLTPEIPLVCVCGNHDVGDSPTQQTVNSYKEKFGDDYFTFWVGGKSVNTIKKLRSNIYPLSLEFLPPFEFTNFEFPSLSELDSAEPLIFIKIDFQTVGIIDSRGSDHDDLR